MLVALLKLYIAQRQTAIPLQEALALHGVKMILLLCGLSMIALTGSSNLSEDLGVQSNDERSCPPWFTMEESGSNCTCGKSLEGIITCQPGHGTGIKIKSCYCMTSEQFNATVLGACSYTCLGAHWSPDPLQLNYEMCTKRWKRTGRLCSQCIDGHGLLVYSYSMQCVPCSCHQRLHSVISDTFSAPDSFLSDNHHSENQCGQTSHEYFCSCWSGHVCHRVPQILPHIRSIVC